MMFSKHNIISKIKDSDNYYIVNLLSKNADILDPETTHRYLQNSLTPEDERVFSEKGYAADPEKEVSLYRRAYIDFIQARDESEVQLFFVPTYACNFACTYCYQEQYSNPDRSVTPEIIDAFFSYVDNEFTDRNKYITIFGGEPLLPSTEYKHQLEYFIRQAAKRELGIAVVTNGYHLSEYLDILTLASVREIQVTLDGTEDVHDRRRPLHGGGGTFGPITAGIDEALRRQLPVNLRVVVDKENINALPGLARLAGDRGWIKNDLFKTQLGRNYELHGCQRDREKLFSRLEMYEAVYALLEEYPEVGAFHRPAFSVSRFLFDNGELPAPLFDSCPGCTTEWAFDYTGRIYSCTATVGKNDEALGTFYPEVKLDDTLVEEWEDRDVDSINECSNCNVRLACGGGCAAVAKNKSGSILTPDCRPVAELIELGSSVYFEKKLIKSQENV